MNDCYRLPFINGSLTHEKQNESVSECESEKRGEKEIVGVCVLLNEKRIFHFFASLNLSATLLQFTTFQIAFK
jgi:hypothetical protein